MSRRSRRRAGKVEPGRVFTHPTDGTATSPRDQAQPGTNAAAETGGRVGSGQAQSPGPAFGAPASRNTPDEDTRRPERAGGEASRSATAHGQAGRAVGEPIGGASSEEPQAPGVGDAVATTVPERGRPRRATAEADAPRAAARARSGPVRSLRQARVTAHALLAGHRSALIVEDNPWLSSVLADALVGEHYKVLQTASPRVADRLARSYRPNVIVLDLELPEAAGLGLLDQLKRTPRTRPIPVVALSSQPERTPPDVRQATHAVMSKPFVLPELLAELSEAVGFRPGHPGSDTAA